MARYDLQQGEDPGPIKLLNMGVSGVGKSGMIASLANAGYTVYILDYDNGTNILADYLTEEGARRVYVEHLTDKMKADGLYIWPDGVPKAFSNGLRKLQNWTEKDEEGKVLKLGGINTWDRKVVLVLDSLTFFSRAAMRYEQYMDMDSNERETREGMERWAHPWPRDYGGAQNRVERFFDLCYSNEVQCNIVVNAHIRWVGGGGKQLVKDKNTGAVYMREVDSELEGIGYPVTVGQALSKIIARFFNNVVMTEVQGSGLSGKPTIITRSRANVPLKVERPSLVPETIPVDGGKRGMAELFEKLRGPFVP